MARLKVIEKLRDGESVVGELIDTGNGVVKLKDKDGETTMRVSVSEEVIDTIDDEVETDDIIEIKRVGSSYEIFTHDDWPKEKEGEK